MTDLGPGLFAKWALRDRIHGKRELQALAALDDMRAGRRCRVYCASKGQAALFERQLDELCEVLGLQALRHLVTVHSR